MRHIHNIKEEITKPKKKLRMNMNFETIPKKKKKGLIHSLMGH
ncbi:unnamed protein product [Nezara viridula]|uniref:Uncharacterized protein n=1 Tax=Nezara viridula TaxID=85310 RepID=A0A9P0MNA3_NEZVI|nr:unnamed protein product [Nezara viridula]